MTISKNAAGMNPACRVCSSKRVYYIRSGITGLLQCGRCGFTWSQLEEIPA